MSERMTKETAAEYCETLLRHFAKDLTEWEDKFVRSVQEQVKSRDLSERQARILNDVMDRCARSRD